MSHKNRQQKESRLQYLNARATLLHEYQMNGGDLAAARTAHPRLRAEGNAVNYPTITQAEKFIKAIPREVRERYEREVRAEQRIESDKLESLPSTQKASAKSRKKAKRGAKGATNA